MEIQYMLSKIMNCVLQIPLNSYCNSEKNLIFTSLINKTASVANTITS